MTKTKGFTAVELVLVIAICCIIAALVVGGFDHTGCLGGYLWVSDVNGTLHQVIGADGFPVKCSR